jgi:hypothetical protein
MLSISIPHQIKNIKLLNFKVSQTFISKAYEKSDFTKHPQKASYKSVSPLAKIRLKDFKIDLKEKQEYNFTASTLVSFILQNNK